MAGKLEEETDGEEKEKVENGGVLDGRRRREQTEGIRDRGRIEF